MKDTDIDVGVVAKSDIIDPAVAGRSLALKSGEVSAPVKGTFGTVLLQVSRSNRPRRRLTRRSRRRSNANSPNSAHGLKSIICATRSKTNAPAAPLAETAKKLNLNAVNIEAVDRSGRGPDGQPIAALPKSPDVVASAFATDVGVDNEALQLPGNGYLYYDVTGITPARDRTLDDEVKDQVATRQRDDEIAKRLQAKADDMLGKLKAGADRRQIATDNGLGRNRLRHDAWQGLGLPAGEGDRRRLQDRQRLPGQRRRRQGDRSLCFGRDPGDRSGVRSKAPEVAQLTTSMQEFVRRRHHRPIHREDRKRYRRLDQSDGAESSYRRQHRQQQPVAK